MSPLNLLLLLSMGLVVAEGSCWETWSRCTKATKIFTGVFWLDCNKRCICLGKTGGECKESETECPLWRSGKAWRCICNKEKRQGEKPDYC